MDNMKLFEVLQIMIRQIGGSKYNKHFVLKGGSALMTLLLESNKENLFRKTSDIDLHVDSAEIWREFKSNVESILNSNPYGAIFSVISSRDKSEVSDSITLQADYSGGSDKVKIDMNVGVFSTITMAYLPTLGINSYDCETMLVDKINAVSSQKIFRRIKDLYDICAISQLKNYSSADILKHIEVKRPEFFTDGKNMLVPENIDNLEHAYSQYRGISMKPKFELVLNLCINFLEPFYLRIENVVWNGEKWIKQ